MRPAEFVLSTGYQTHGQLGEALVEQLMGRRPELRLEFIQAHAQDVESLDV